MDFIPIDITEDEQKNSSSNNQVKNVKTVYQETNGKRTNRNNSFLNSNQTLSDVSTEDDTGNSTDENNEKQSNRINADLMRTYQPQTSANSAKIEQLANIATQFSIEVHNTSPKTGEDKASTYFLLEYDTSNTIDTLTNKVPSEEVQINMTEYKAKHDEFVDFSKKIKKTLKKINKKNKPDDFNAISKYVDFHLENENNNFSVTEEKIKKSKPRLIHKSIKIELEAPILLNKNLLMKAITQKDAEFSKSFNENQLIADMDTYARQLISLNALRTEILLKYRDKAKKLAADEATEAISIAEKAMKLLDEAKAMAKNAKAKQAITMAQKALTKAKDAKNPENIEKATNLLEEAKAKQAITMAQNALTKAQKTKVPENIEKAMKRLEEAEAKQVLTEAEDAETID